MTSPETTSEHTRRSLGFRLARELDARGERHELYWHMTVDAGRLLYIISLGRRWADPTTPVLRMTPGECADWLNIPVQT